MRYDLIFGMGAIFVLQGCALSPTLSEDFGFPFVATHESLDVKKISWIVLDPPDLMKKCSELVASKGGGGYFFVGCSAWSAGKCVIYTQRMTTHTILGHELRHCFEGHFH
jgi:hypothetical protein